TVNKLFCAITVAMALCSQANATPVLFNFDTGSPALSAGETLPLSQTSSGLTALFSPQPLMGGFSIQNAGSTFFVLSQLPGNYIYPDSLSPGYLDIAFSQNITSISFNFATADIDIEVPTTVSLNAFETGSLVGSASAHGAYIGDTFPEGVLSFASATPFDMVRIFIPFQPQGSSDFFVDNINVTTANTVTVPEPSGAFTLGVGLLSLISLVRRRKTYGARMRENVMRD
ncbi:MAG TPA: hypothetical protein VKR81_07360, partial [Candidatus Binatia bacterium]|nr:hypothetical protein [Candidatus Binatia bacterium]